MLYLQGTREEPVWQVRQEPYQYLRASIIENNLNTLPGNRNTLMLTSWLFIQFGWPSKTASSLPPSLPHMKLSKFRVVGNVRGWTLQIQLSGSGNSEPAAPHWPCTQFIYHTFTIIQRWSCMIGCFHTTYVYIGVAASSYSIIHFVEKQTFLFL